MSKVVLDKSVVVNGETWYLFSITFESVDDSTYSTYLYAKDAYHASLLLEDMKDHAKLFGQVL